MPSNPDWRASVAAAVAELPTAQRRGATDAAPVAIDILPGAYGAVLTAARARRVSVASYVRRAALAMAAHDLQVPLAHLLERDPRMARETGASMPDPTGTRFGFWEIERLVGEP